MGIRYRSVICSGKAYFITGPDKKRVGLDGIIDYYNSDPIFFLEKELQNLYVVRIDIDEMTGKKSEY